MNSVRSSHRYADWQTGKHLFLSSQEQSQKIKQPAPNCLKNPPSTVPQGWKWGTFCPVRSFRKLSNKHCKKRLAVFLSPAGMSLTKLSLDGTGINKWFPSRESLVCDIPAGDGKTSNLFLQWALSTPHPPPRSGKIRKCKSNRPTSLRSIALGEDCCNKVRTFRSTKLSQFRGKSLT